MAFGFTPKHIKSVPLDGLTPEEFLVVAVEAAKQLKWNVLQITEHGFVGHTKLSLTSWNEEIIVNIEEASAQILSKCTGNQLFDWNKNKKNTEEFASVVAKQKKGFSAEELSQKYEELKQNFKSVAVKPFETHLTTKGKIRSFFDVFIPTQDYFITPILILLNIAIYILMVSTGVNFFFPELESMVDWGANFKAFTLGGEWWRLFTNFFLHFGLIHLLMNMYALFYIGLLLEPHLGKVRFLGTYLLAGLVASVASMWWYDNNIVSAGASGAIFGMYGVFLALLTTDAIDKSIRKSSFISILAFVGYNIFIGLNTQEGIDNAAHIGGLVSGLLMGYAWIPSLKNPGSEDLKNGTIGILSALVIFGTVIVYKNFPDQTDVFSKNDIEVYEREMQEFISMEQMALKIYDLPGGPLNPAALYQLKDIGIYYWIECINVIDKFEKLKLPRELKDRNILLKEYCNLRIKSYELMYAAILEGTDIYSSEIEHYNSKIEAIIISLVDNQE